jgi:hypothetical protein
MFTSYPLRPELFESVWYVYQATKDPWLLDFAYEMLQRYNIL